MTDILCIIGLFGAGIAVGFAVGAFAEWSVHNRSEGEMEPFTKSCDNCAHGDLDWDEDPCDTCGEDHDCWEAANEYN